MLRKASCPVCGEGSTFAPEIFCESGCSPIVRYYQAKVTRDERFETAVTTIATTLHQLYGSAEYVEATAHGANSSKIQGLITPQLRQLEFESEIPNRVGLAGFKPDFMSKDGEIMVEVERGKTLDNNMDMLDMWKCHVHPNAKYLILVVPVWYYTGKERERFVGSRFAKVCQRLQLFFREGNETNVLGVGIIGY